MCGIFAVVGGIDAPARVIAGLKRLEYRGYDSWGVGALDNKNIVVEKRVGKVSEVGQLALPSSQIALGHTRWATHGGVTQNNAHPHASSDHSFILAQNGVVENFSQLKERLQEKGYSFGTQTDTEVIVRLIEDELSKLRSNEADRRREAVLQAFHQLHGRNTVVLLMQDGCIYAARNGSPLLLGHNTQTGSYTLSSDILSFADEADEYGVIENGQLVEIRDSQCSVFHAATGKQIDYLMQSLDIQHTESSKGDFPHFMLKEIHDTPSVISQVAQQPVHMIDQLALLLRTTHEAGRKVYCIGSGTAGIAAAQTAYYLRQLAGIPAISLVGADALDYISLLDADDVMIAPSQSGETADVLEVLEVARAKKVKIVTYVNMPASSMTRIADYSFLAQAGPEICVMSTKVFTSQIAWGYLVAKSVAGQYQDAVEHLEQLSAQVHSYLHHPDTCQHIRQIARWLASKNDIFLLAKGENFQIIREGMVKIIEGSYIHAHALPAGDLKHYAITLIEEGTPVIVVHSNDETQLDTMTAAHEVHARGASVVHVGASQGNESTEWSIHVPNVAGVHSIMSVIPLQLLAYELAVILGNDVDHPRNIAKSVTVK